MSILAAIGNLKNYVTRIRLPVCFLFVEAMVIAGPAPYDPPVRFMKPADSMH